MESVLLGHWPLAGDCRDVSGNGHHGENHGTDLRALSNDRPSALFDGRQSNISVADNPTLRTGTDNFTIAASIFTETNVDDPIGDIIAKFDPKRRNGFNLGLKRHSAACSSLANWRNLHFGIDDSRLDEDWTDCGRPGNAVFVMALAVHEGHLYAGTCEAGKDEAGHVFRYAGAANWENLGTPDGANAVMTLAPFEGALYCGTGRLKLLGSSLPPSGNQSEGGHVFRLEEDRWFDCGQMGGERGNYAEYCHDTVGALEVFQGHLYGVPLYTQGLFRYGGDNRWTNCGSYGRRAFSLGAFRDDLHLLDNGNSIYRYASGENWTRWTRLAELPGVSQVYSMAIYQGEMVVGTWPEGRVFRRDSNEVWSDMGRLGDELEVMGMAVYNGKLYAGTLPSAQVYRYDDDSQWSLIGQLDQTPEVKYRRAWSTAIYDGKLFFGTLPAGRVLKLEAGRNATFDQAMAPGWRHVAAVRKQGMLTLYVNGKAVAHSSGFTTTDYNINNSQPLSIGCGQHDFFKGRISDIRIYRGALTSIQIQNIVD